MSVDAACTACCCDVPPPVCCFPDLSKPFELNYVERTSVYAGTTEVSRTLFSAQIITTMVRSGSAATGYVMQSSGGTAAIRSETFSKVSKAIFWGSSCPGFPNDYQCPPCNSFIDCESYEWVYSGGLPSSSLEIRCFDPCNPFNGTRKTFGIFNGPGLGQIVGTATTRTGNNEPDVVATCGPPIVNSIQTAFYDGIVGGIRTIWGREGCLGSSTFSQGHVAGSSLPTGWPGPCSPNPVFSSSIDCVQWATNPSYVIPARMGYTVSDCPVLQCNPFNADASTRGSPVECILFDCFGNVISYAVSGCDTIFPGNGQGTGCEISVRSEISLSASIVYG